MYILSNSIQIQQKTLLYAQYMKKIQSGQNVFRFVDLKKKYFLIEYISSKSLGQNNNTFSEDIMKNLRMQQGRYQVRNLNVKLKDYLKLSTKEQEHIRKDVINIFRHHKDQFRNRLKNSKAKIMKLNLIIGVTGSGKSTLFNYLNRLPLIIKEGFDSNGKKNNTIKLGIEQAKIEKGRIFAPIGHGYASETTIPNFAPALNSDFTYVDCAGQFDNRDILQSIINSYFKYELATQAKKIKLTIVINYYDIFTNRGTVFNKILKEVGNFIGLWEEFSKNKCISLVVTQVKPQIKQPKTTILSAIKDICTQVKDLGPFKEILEDIIKREAVAVFLQPNYKNMQVLNQDGETEYCYYVPEGQSFKPSSKVCSPELISQTLEQTNFMEYEQGLFVYNLEKEVQGIVNVICDSLIKDLKNELYDMIMMNLLKRNQSKGRSMESITVEEIKSEKSYCAEIIQKLRIVKNTYEIIQIFKLEEELLNNYNSLRTDLEEFLKICNIINLEKKIAQVSSNVISFFKERLISLNSKEIQIINKQHEKSILRNSKLQQQLNSKKQQVALQMKKTQLQAKHKKEELQFKRHQLQLQKQKEERQHQLQMQRLKQQQQKRRLQDEQSKRQMANTALNMFSQSLLTLLQLGIRSKLRK